MTKDWLNLSDWLTSKESLKVLPNKVFRFIHQALDRTYLKIRDDHDGKKRRFSLIEGNY
ncbi:MAG: hypothetical protein ACKPJN_22170 [Microcystis panniformis]